MQNPGSRLVSTLALATRCAGSRAACRAGNCGVHPLLPRQKIKALW